MLIQKIKEAKWMDDFKGAGDKILVAEDEEGMQELVVDVLEDAGYSVIVVNDGVEAVEVFKKRRAELCLVILDKNMPKMNGYEAFKEMKKLGLGVPLLLSSGSGEDEKNFLDAGITGFIAKPYRVADLVEKVKLALENRKKI